MGARSQRAGGQLQHVGARAHVVLGRDVLPALQKQLDHLHPVIQRGPVHRRVAVLRAVAVSAAPSPLAQGRAVRTSSCAATYAPTSISITAIASKPRLAAWCSGVDLLCAPGAGEGCISGSERRAGRASRAAHIVKRADAQPFVDEEVDSLLAFAHHSVVHHRPATLRAQSGHAPRRSCREECAPRRWRCRPRRAREGTSLRLHCPYWRR